MSKIFKPTYLYVKTHNETNLKYFGKTTKDPFKYRGSGKYWLAHLKIHGDNVTTEIIGYYTNKDECKQAAIQFSINNNIVFAVNEDNKKIWANMIVENGLDGGDTGRTNYGHTEETKQKLREVNLGRKHSPETRAKMSEISAARKGIKRGPLPIETKQKLRDANLGKKRTAESIKKGADKLKGRKRPEVAKKMKGRKHSLESIARMKESQKGRIVSEETKQKIRDARSKQIFTDETKEKLKGFVVAVNKEGERKRIPKEQYFSQAGPKEKWEWVSHRSVEAKTRMR